MNVTSLFLARLTIPVTLHLFEHHANKHFFSCAVKLRVGLFRSIPDALVWEEEFVKAAILGWEERVKGERLYQVEEHRATGRAIRALTGEKQVKVIAAPANKINKHSRLYIEINGGLVETIRRQVGKPSDILPYNLDPSIISPIEVAVDIKGYIRSLSRDALDDL
jgi:hypothetical protein